MGGSALGGKMHQCSACPKSFPSPYKLQRHYVTHTGLKPFTCTICGKAFTQSDHLKTHSQKVHHSRRANGNPAAGINTHGSSNYAVMPSIVSSSVASQTERKEEIVAPKIVVHYSETGNSPVSKPHGNDTSLARSSISNVMIPKPQEQIDSANVDTSVCNSCNGSTCKVCLESFSSSLHLWIHSPTLNKGKQFERGRESGQSFSKQASTKGHPQSQELSSSRSKMSLKHQCLKCLKTFCSPSKLQRHSLVHTGQKPYSCMTCWKAFRQKVHLESHLRSSKKCSPSASTDEKKQRFCNSRKTSGLQPQSSLQQQPAGQRTPVNSSVGLELQCKIRVKTEIKSDEVVNPEQSLHTASQCQHICHKLDDQEHQNQKESGSLTTVQNSNNVKISDSEAMQHLPEPSHSDHIDLNIIVKPEPWSGTCGEYNDSVPQDSKLITSTKQKRKTCRAASKMQNMNSLHQCHTCLKCFPYSSKLQRHVRIHTGQRPFGCETCGKTFRQETHLRVHSRTHLWSRYHKQRSLYINRPPSGIGGFNTRTSADVPVQEMLLHVKDFETHTGSDVASVKHLDQIAKLMRNPGNRQHKCFQCFKCFPSASKLQRHEMVHTGLKPFQCVLCGKAFRQAPHLKNHERTHCNTKPSKPVNQQENIRKLQANSQQQLYPRKSVRISQQKKKFNTDTTLSKWDGAGVNGASAFHRSRRETSTTNMKCEVNFTTNSKRNVAHKKRKHACQICFKNFRFPYMISRHMVIHSGIRPYKCTLCSKTFTQRGHLRGHEKECRQGNSQCDHGEMRNTSDLQVKCIENPSDCTDFYVDATRKQLESQYASVGHYSFTDGDLPSCSEAIHTGWLAVPEVEVKEENEQRDDYNHTTYNHDHATENYSFPSELALEISKLAQNQNMAAPPLSHQREGNAHNVKVPCQPKRVMAMSDSNKLLSDELVSSVVENQTQPDDYWCEPLTVFECDKCSVSFESKTELRQHICSTNVQPKTTKSAQKNHCNICSKCFVSPSKLSRHYLIHTGQRPFRCDICGKRFTQSAHLRTHQQAH